MAGVSSWAERPLERYPDDGETTPLQHRARLAGLQEDSLRQAFAIKVYGIVAAQLLATTFLAGLIGVAGEELLREHTGWVLVGMVLSLIVVFTVTCIVGACPLAFRSFPGNYILLGIFTIAEGSIVGFACIGYTLESILIVLAITAFVFSALSVVAACTSWDFTGAGPYLFCALLVLTGFGLCLVLASAAALGDSPGEYAKLSPAFETARIFYAALGALLFSLYIVFDTQMIIGGKHEHQFGYDDYAMAALSIYIDLIGLMLHLLSLFGERD